MVWSYNSPTDSEKDEVRFLIGDTMEEDQLLQDEEINYMLDQSRNLYLAAAKCCEAIAAKFARLADRSFGPKSINASQKHEHYIEMAEKYRKRGRTDLPYFGGIDPTEDGRDTHLNQPVFDKDMMTKYNVDPTKGDY